MWGQALLQAWAEKPGPLPRLIGGRYGPGPQKTSIPSDGQAVFDALARPDHPGPAFTRVGHHERTQRLSLPVDATSAPKPPDFRAIRLCLGSDGKPFGATRTQLKIHR